MTVDFEVFEAGPVVQNTDRPHVTISKLGHIFLNRHALALFGDPIAVTLMYDRKRKIIGVMPTPERVPASEKGWRSEPRPHAPRKQFLQALLDPPNRNPRLHLTRNKQQRHPDPKSP